MFNSPISGYLLTATGNSATVAYVAALISGFCYYEWNRRNILCCKYKRHQLPQSDDGVYFSLHRRLFFKLNPIDFNRIIIFHHHNYGMNPFPVVQQLCNNGNPACPFWHFCLGKQDSVWFIEPDLQG